METKIFQRQWAVLNDYRVAYRQWGSKGKPIVLLHGIPTNSILWHRIGLALSTRGYRVYAPEMLGLGYTEGPANDNHSLWGQARLFSQFINTVVNDEYILVGHDLGGGVAQIMAAEFSTPIRKFVLTNCVAFDSWPVEGIQWLIGASSRENYARLFSPSFVLNFLRKALAAGLMDTAAITDELLDDLCQGLVGTQERTEHFVSFLRAMDNRYTQSASPRLKDFGQATLLIWAKSDPFQPISVGERLRAILPHVTWKLIEGSHFHPLESSALADAIIEWDASEDSQRF